MVTKAVLGRAVSVLFVFVFALQIFPARSVAGNVETVALDASRIIRTPKEITELLSIIEQAVIIKTNAEKKTLLGATMKLESILSDTLASTGKSIRVFPQAIYGALEEQVAKGEKDKRKIADALVTAYRLGKLSGGSSKEKIVLKLEDGVVTEVSKEAK